jgi:predicted cupin superfamily sugar epimerase
MQPHPEGGFFVEVHRSPHLTEIFFLLRAGDVSRWHRVRGSDEVWHYHEGAPLELLTAGLDFERLDRHSLGPVEGSRRPIHVVEAGVWQAARSIGDYTLVGCTVSPPFDFANFDMLRDDAEVSARARATQPAGADFI